MGTQGVAVSEAGYRLAAGCVVDYGCLLDQKAHSGDILLLRTLSVSNFRCFGSLENLPFNNITAFIGPNDSGKSSILLLLRHCLSNTPISAGDFRDVAQPITVELVFSIMRAHEAEQLSYFQSTQVRIRKRFEAEQRPTTEIYRDCYVDDRLENLGRLTVAELQGILDEFDIPGRYATKAERALAVRTFLDEHKQPRCQTWCPAGSELDEVLPEYIMFGADEDLTLQSGPLVTTLRSAFKAFLKEEPLDEVQLILQRANEKLQQVIAGITPSIQRFVAGDLELVLQPSLDLANSLVLGEVLLRTPSGETRRFASLGDGTKRRIILGLFNWANDVYPKVAREEGRSLLWGFDEPDTHLHYKAQYELLATLKGLADAGMQVIMCTHSVPMIDSLPPTAIRQMVQIAEGLTTVDYLRTDVLETDDVAAFLAGVGQGIGFMNSLLFYERCFILAEGPTESKAVPILYQTLYQQDLFSSGIRIFPAESHAAVLMLALLLHHNGKRVVILLDSDTKGIKEIKSHIKKLKDAGFDVDRHIVYVGTREFEDAFDNEALCLCLNRHYPRCDGFPWVDGHIDHFRRASTAQSTLQDSNSHKFSEAFVRVEVRRASTTTVTKPEFGRQLASCITEERLIPEAIKHLFSLARDISRA